MGWADLLSTTEIITVPWIGGRSIRGAGRTWKVKGSLPEEHGWHSFEVSGGREAIWKGPGEPDLFWEENQKDTVKGYLVGNRLIPDNAEVVLDPTRIFNQTINVHFVEPGLDRFVRAMVVFYEQDKYIFARQEFPLGPEAQVMEAFFDRIESINNIPEVTPSLDLAFRFETFQREQQEERRRLLEERRLESERRRQEEERRKQLVEQVGTGAGRRELAKVDFIAAAKAALSISGARLIDQRESYNRNEMIVQFLLEGRRFECVIEKETLHVVDSGICLNDHDHFFTLESLPPVISQARREGLLHVYRHV